MGLETRIRERIHREGAISFAEYMEFALYEPTEGFFTRGGGAGRAGRDFVTSPEVGSLFGMVIARALDDAWRRMGEPDPFVVVEAGAGRGRLAADVVRAAPACSGALRYVLVERSASLREEQRERLPLEPPDEALGPFMVSDDGESSEPVPGRGPIVVALDDLPAVRLRGVVLANELFDNLPVHVVERAPDGGWLEVRVTTDGDRFVEVLVPASPPIAAEADLVAEGAVVDVGARIPVPIAARAWLERVAAMLVRGEVILFDYVDTVSKLAARGQESWMRTYRAHQRGGDPLDAPGTQDITCDLPLEYLRTIAERVGLPIREYVPQREWMGHHGIAELVAEGDTMWQEGAARGDLVALAGRSRGVEAAALTDPGGLGAHRVLVLRKAV
jgi:SAM-dependent MidA family methyltransferase